MISEDDSFYSANVSFNSTANASFSSLTDTLGDILRRNFNHQKRNLFNVCHINAQSVPSHYSDLFDTFSDANVHAVLISESWLKPHLLSTTYSLPGFILIRNDRIGKGGGGVAIYLRSDFPFKVLASSPSNYSASTEYLFLEVYVKGVKTLLGVVYCPPAVDYFSNFELALESVGSEYAHCIIMGDFNTDLSRPAPRSHKLLHIVESASLHILPLQPTHYNVLGDDTWLDLILTSTPSLVSSHGQCPAPGFSNHDLIFLSYTLKPPKTPPKVLHMRCFARMDVEKLRQDASELDWESVAAAVTVDDKLGLFNRTVLALYDRHAPVKRVKLRRPPAPWMTTGVRMAMRRRDRAFRKFRKNRCDENRNLFKTARNRCNQVIRNAKRRHILENISSSSPADIWKFLGTLGIGRSRHVDFPKTIGLDDINRHFTTTCHLDSQMLSHTVDFITGLPGPIIEQFHFSPATLDEIRKIILSIKSKAMGFDGISRYMVTLILDFLLPPITHIINFSLDSAQFPSLWRMAYVRPLPKIANPSLCNHFRPISILPFLSKVLEACVHKQLSGFVHRNNLVSSFQSGFRPGHSTASALLKVTGDIREAMEDTKVTVLVLIDFSNAFNAVSHDILLSILSHLMVSSEALEWFSSYLRGRQQSVRVDESSSSWCNLAAGVPQGGILSPLLFSIFINFITHCLRCSYHLYADDLQLYAAARVEDLSDAIGDVNRDLAAVKNWSDRFGVSVNPSKCQAIVIGSSRMLGRVGISSLPPIIFNDTVIPISPSVKDLGLHLDSTLGWQSQVSSVSQRVNGTLRCLYRLRNFLPAKTKTMLVQTLIFPIIDYGDVCYFDLNAVFLDKLDRLLNNCIRFIFNLRKYDHVSSCRSELKWMPIRQRRNLRALTTLFSLLNSPTPPSYLTPHFQYLCTSHARNLRSSNNLLLLCPSHTSDFIHSSFHIQSILLWNALPLDIRMATSQYAFKRKLRHYFLHQ